MSPLVENSGTIFFRSTSGWDIEVKLIPDWLCPYLPAAARALRNDILPYIALDDLIVFKADACGLREHDDNKRQEALDTAALLDLASVHSPLQIDESKMDRIKQALSELVEFSPLELDLIWWQRRLGKITQSPESIQTILSELADGSSPRTPLSSDTASARSSIYSTLSRTSSSFSSASTQTVASSSGDPSPSEPRSPEKNGRPRKMSMTSKKPRHQRFPSTGVHKASSLDVAMQRLDLGRSASPGVSLTNRG